MNEIKTKFINFFKSISDIPHPSGETENLKTFLVKYAKDLNLEVIEDNLNLIIKLPASEDCSQEKPIIIQGHLDMVALKKPHVKHDFSSDKLNISCSEDEKYLYAEGTSLGGDDGFALCYMMMLMQESDFSHPPLYFVLTADEEIGCIGAQKLNTKYIEDAGFMINLDCEQEGFSPNASAAGETVSASSQYTSQVSLGTLWQVALSYPGTAHPVISVNDNSIQPTQILAQILLQLFLVTNSRLVYLECSNKPGTLANHSQALFITTTEDETIIKELKTIVMSFMSTYSKLETKPTFTIPISLGVQKYESFTREDSLKILREEAFLPTGVLIREENHPVASIALVSCTIGNGVSDNVFQIRGKDTAIVQFLQNRLFAYLGTKQVYASVNIDALPWQLKENSDLFRRANKVWRERENTDLISTYSHGFLENGFFQNALPDLDIVSLGPTVLNIHSADEKLDLDSAVKVYEFLKELLSDFKPTVEEDSVLIERTDGTKESILNFYKNKNLNETDCSSCPLEFKKD